ncbi:MAG TPA: glutamine synthetase family protein [Rugosimonospora sp.]|nr:glutamine synthetase family protein [Rugosimonospora sp.]
MQPADRAYQAAQARQAAAGLAARGVAGVAVTWVDNSGVVRVKGVPVARLERAAQWGVGMSPVFDTFLSDDSLVTGRFAGGPVGDLRLHPDLRRLTVLAAQPGWAWAPADRYDQDGAEHPQDARSLARREVDRLAGAGYTVRAGFEVEWCVSIGTAADEFTPACQGPAYGMARLTELSDYLREVLDALAAQQVAVDQLHPEYAAGQYEVSVAPEDPVGAADTAVLVRETIRAVSARRGLRATFAPKVLADGVGNGGHVHLSLWRDGTNLMSGGTGRYGITPEGEAFTAGILGRLPALLAFGAPSVASYLRLVPSHWAGAFACWGRENREAALRFVTGTAGNQGTESNVEVKCFDAAANPYLALAALLCAGRAGLAERAALPEPVEVDPTVLEPAERDARGIAALPSTLDGAVAALEAEAVLVRDLGEELVDTVAAVRRGEIARFTGASPEEVAAATRWKY